MSRFARRLLALLATAVLAVMATSGPALAHAGITGTDPEPGTALDAMPNEVVFSFTEVLQEPSFASVTHNGDVVEDWEATLDGERFIVTPPVDAPEGSYVVAYRVVSTDGHPIEGSTNFTVGDAPAEQPTDDPADGNDVATPDDEADETGASTLLSSPWLWGGIIVLAVIVLAVTASRRPRGEDSQS